METENKKPNIHQRVLNIMRDVSFVSKDGRNEHSRYNYASHDNVVASVRDAWIEHGVIMTCNVVEHQYTQHTVKSGETSNLTSLVAEVSFINVDDPADKIVVRMIGQGLDKNELGPGKAISYATKYAILKTFALETGDDPERESKGYTSSKGGSYGNKPAYQGKTPANPPASSSKSPAQQPAPAMNDNQRWQLMKQFKEVVSYLTPALNERLMQNGLPPFTSPAYVEATVLECIGPLTPEKVETLRTKQLYSVDKVTKHVMEKENGKAAQPA